MFRSTRNHESAVATGGLGRLVGAIGVTVGVMLLIVGGTWWLEGVASAVRAATDCIMPLSLFWFTMLFCAVCCWGSGQTGWAFGLGIGWLTLGMIGNGRVASLCMASVEWPIDVAAEPFEPVEPYRAIVVLGGGVAVDADGKPVLGSDGQRVISAAQLWYAKRTRAIICTGTSSNGSEDPSRTGRRMLESLGVPSDVIYEVPGVNTFEEMRSLRSFLLDPPKGFPVGEEVGLVTSAFHMSRALRLSRDRGLDLVPLPCARRVGLAQPFSPAELIPAGPAAESLRMALKEHLARLAGR